MAPNIFGSQMQQEQAFQLSRPCGHLVVPAQPLGLLQVAQAEEEKANQERCFARTRMLFAHLYLKSVLQNSIYGNLHICAHHPKVRCIWIQV